MLSIALLLHPQLIFGADVLVGIGTFFLAFVTGILALATVGIEKWRQARERRGVARLVSAELGLLQDTIEEALRGGFWWFYWPLPHAAWDRGGQVIVTDLRDPEVVIDAFADVGTWERFTVRQSEGDPTFPLNVADLRLLIHLVPKLHKSRKLLERLAPGDSGATWDEHLWDELKRLVEQLEAGTLSQEEFDAEKARLLPPMP
jgi:hypothetical protein